MEDYPIARIYRDVAAMTIGAGTSEVMREIISRENKIGVSSNLISIKS